jgi:hypothetical protein
LGETGNACKTFDENPVWKKLLGRPKGRWEDNIEMDLK